MPENDKSKTYLDRAYHLDGQDETRALYADWAQTYDEDLVKKLDYCGPEELAGLIAARAADPDGAILDAGAGTGLVGQSLAKRGFTTIDGIDLSPDMLDVAGRKGVYRTLSVADMTKRLPVADGAYQVVTSCGTFTHAHVGPVAFDELVRVTAPGGLFMPAINTALHESAGFAARIADLVASGLVADEGHAVIPLVRSEGVDGFVPFLRRV